ncbi:glutathione S-transferase [Allohahella marinimesophila]|uniref:Glutathione S-transferase n=1 Tax=Allohahella marinimesophila TaxID=1054972 RepID=A0ABP7PHX6_9GAMM
MPIAQLPILYSFRRCPYAIRARLALAYAARQVILREVVLRDKPQALIDASAKATVPVLVLPDGAVIEQSIEIMQWALARSDPEAWLLRNCKKQQHEAQTLIERNDQQFKQALDRYKYADRHPQQSAEAYRREGEVFLKELEMRLARRAYLITDRISIADAAIFPFVRQFAHTDKTWFYHAPYPNLQRWLQRHLNSSLFNNAMHKYPAWQPDAEQTLFPVQV